MMQLTFVLVFYVATYLQYGKFPLKTTKDNLFVGLLLPKKECRKKMGK